MTVYTVIVTMPDHGFDPWAIAFSSREKAEKYKAELKKRIQRADSADELVVTIDSGELDDGQYYLDAVDHWDD